MMENDEILSMWTVDELAAGGRLTKEEAAQQLVIFLIGLFGVGYLASKLAYQSPVVSAHSWARRG